MKHLSGLRVFKHAELLALLTRAPHLSTRWEEAKL